MKTQSRSPANHLPRARNSSGFTLVEILMVVVILGIASAIMIPQLNSRDDLRAAAAARMLMADLNYAQNRAIAQQQKHYVKFQGQQYSICTSNNGTLTAIDHPLLPAQFNGKYIVQFGAAGSNGLDRDALGTVSFGGKSIIGFNDLGEPFAFDGVTETSLSSSGTIIVQSGTYSLTIQIEPFTGETSAH